MGPRKKKKHTIFLLFLLFCSQCSWGTKYWPSLATPSMMPRKSARWLWDEICQILLLYYVLFGLRDDSFWIKRLKLVVYIIYQTGLSVYWVSYACACVHLTRTNISTSGLFVYWHFKTLCGPTQEKNDNFSAFLFFTVNLNCWEIQDYKPFAIEF